MSETDDSIVSDDISVASEGSDYDYDERSQASFQSRASKASRSSRGHGSKKSPKGGSLKDQSEEYGDYSADFMDDFEADESEEQVKTVSSSSSYKQATAGAGASNTNTNTNTKSGSVNLVDSLLPPRERGSGGRSSKGGSGIASPRESSRSTYQSAGASAGTEQRGVPYTNVSNVSRLPTTMGQQSLQAEIVLDEISKEVMQLRNLQREQLKERHSLAKERKARAEERRLIYNQRLQEATDMKNNFIKEKDEYINNIHILENQIKSITLSKDVVFTSLHAIEDDNEKLRNTINILTNDIKKLNDENIKLEKKYINDKNNWDIKEATLLAETRKATLLQDAVQKSIEANEKRFLKERENLPEYQAKALKEQQERLTLYEIDLKSQQGILRALETQKIADIEQMRKEAKIEINQLRDRKCLPIAFAVCLPMLCAM
jgi:hypothetical protein